MKCHGPQISWHSRNPVLSIDFQPIQSDVLRLASGGTDSHVLIWYITRQENKPIKIECASDLYRHNKSVNVVRFSPNGEFLASGDDEGAMFIWELKEREQAIEPPNDDENTNKEDWYPVKLLRGHLDDIYDISWSKDGNFLVSSSMDNTVITWDMQKYTKTHIFSDFKGYVQGVSLDPLNQYIASIGSDRTLRIHNANSKKIVYRISKAPWTNSTEKGTFRARLFYDDTLQSYFRRLTFTPDGELLIVPSGILEKGEKVTNTCYIFSRYALNKPVISLPAGDKYTVAVKCNPFLYKLHKGHDTSDKENELPKPMIDLPYRMIFAVAACDSVLLYDTEQLLPFAYVSNIHYTHLTDLSWSPDGLTLVVSSTDGYCSFISFSKGELGEIYIPEKPKDAQKESSQVTEATENEKMVVCEADNVTKVEGSGTEAEVKLANPPVTPKRITPVPVNSPKPVSATKDETTASKISKNVVDSKKVGKKSPKMCSIKNFFISPKTMPSNSVSRENNKTPPCSANKAVASTSKVIEEIDISDSPLKDKIEKSNMVPGPEKIDKNSEVEPMDVEITDLQVDKVKTSPKSSAPGKQSKCKIRLDFTDKEQLVANIDDNASDSNPTCEPIVDDKNESKRVEGSDWKLELSQDDSMETAPSETASKPSTPKTFNVNSSSSKDVPAVPSTSTGAKSPSESKQTPKRRVAFVTLSSKASFKK